MGRAAYAHRDPSHLFTPDYTNLTHCLFSFSIPWFSQGVKSVHWPDCLTCFPVGRCDQPNWKTTCGRLGNVQPRPIPLVLGPTVSNLTITNPSHTRRQPRKWLKWGSLGTNADWRLQSRRRQVAEPIRARPKAAHAHVYKHTGRHFSNPGPCTCETCKAPFVTFRSHPVQKSILCASIPFVTLFCLNTSGTRVFDPGEEKPGATAEAGKCSSRHGLHCKAQFEKHKRWCRRCVWHQQRALLTSLFWNQKFFQSEKVVFQKIFSAQTFLPAHKDYEDETYSTASSTVYIESSFY